MERSGVYVLSHKTLDESNESSGVDNPTFVDDDKHQEVHFKGAYQPSDRPYRGMGKDELLHHSSKGIWKTFRYICMSLVFVVWLGLIVTVIALIVVYPRCRKADSRQWWQQSTTYRVYVRSFKDSNNDGIGDLKGLTSKLEYLKSIGIGAVSLSPIYKQGTNNDSDYDIVDHKAINPEYGTIDDFKALVNATHQHNMFLILDFVPGFTSNEHQWFVDSKESSLRNNSKKNFYVWEDGSVPPSNWLSMYNGSAWMMDSPRNQYYLHQRHKTEPDLNLRSQAVLKELQSVLKFWLDLGVDGFYIRESAMLLEDNDLTDEPKANSSSIIDPNAYDYYDHIYTYAWHENTGLFARWRYYLDTYGNKTGSYKLLFADVFGDVETNMNYYGMYNRDGVDYPLNTRIQEIGKAATSQAIYNAIKSWIDGLPSGRWSNWLGGGENIRRFSESRAELNRPMLFLTMLLPGSPMVYYGDEIDMTNSPNTPSSSFSLNQPMRTPMQWDNSSMAGFCESCNSTWLPINADSENNTVQMHSMEANSVLSLFKNLTSIRRKASIQHGDFTLFPLGGSVISFIHEFDGEVGYLVAVNVGSTKASHDLSGVHETLPGTVRVVLTTKNGGSYSEEDDLTTSAISLEPYEGVVGSWKYIAKEL